MSELPIEYYDCRLLHQIGNKIGKIVKVDRNTIFLARGKYARICVDIDLTKALVAMFMINDRAYKVEYEGLHLICTTCGKFGHYKEGCSEKETNEHNVQGEKIEDQLALGQRGIPNSKSQSNKINIENEIKGPWVVVQKTRKAQKGKKKDGNGWSGGRKKGAEALWVKGTRVRRKLIVLH